MVDLSESGFWGYMTLFLRNNPPFKGRVGVFEDDRYNLIDVTINPEGGAERPVKLVFGADRPYEWGSVKGTIESVLAQREVVGVHTPSEQIGKAFTEMGIKAKYKDGNPHHFDFKGREYLII